MILIFQTGLVHLTSEMAAPTQDQVVITFPLLAVNQSLTLYGQVTELQDLAHKLRIHSVNMTTASKSGHPTSCSSMAEVC